MSDEKKVNLGTILDLIRKEFGENRNLMDGVEAVISATCSLLLENANGCIAIVLEGGPSSSKTTILNFLKSEDLLEQDFVVSADKFTPASFVSQAAQVSKGELEKVDLLPQIKHKPFVVLDLAPILSGAYEDLQENLGVLTRVLDGQGFKNHGGVHGRRGYEGDHRFALLAATTPMSSSTWKVLGRVGHRIALLEIVHEKISIEDKVAAMKASVPFHMRAEKIKNQIGEFFLNLWDQNNGYRGVKWNNEADDHALLEVIARVAEWVCKCRAAPSTGPKGGNEPLVNESSWRLQETIYNLARGHAIACGRGTLTKADIQIAVRVALDTMPQHRRRVVRALLKSEKGVLKTSSVAKAMDSALPTARDAMRELANIRAVGLTQPEGNSMKVWLRKSERWLLKPSNRWVLARLP